MKNTSDEPFTFSKIRYRRPSTGKSKRKLSKIIGLDSEAYPSGRSFLITTSLGDCWDPKELPRCLFKRRYRGANFVVWNLKYDSGAILQRLPVRTLHKLWKEGKATYKGYLYVYYPHKYLRISWHGNAVTFWDVMQIYSSSLEAASRRYLKTGKAKMNPRKFTPDYVRRNMEAIRFYGVRDAQLTQRLTIFLLEYLGKFGIHPQNLYSRAAISYTFFKQESGIVNVWRFWKNCRRLLEFACEAYAGGKFEVTSRGQFKGYEWDISSAYPYEMSKLIDLKGAKVRHNPRYQKKATYGFLDVDVFIEKDLAHSLVVKLRTLNTYPVGKFKKYVTKEEYDYLKSEGVKMKIHEAFWIYCTSKRRPYARAINKLVRMKVKDGAKDKMIRALAKFMLNGFYGKMVQMTPQPNGTLRAGPGWNPIYGAIITANVRIRMCKAQNLLGKHCLAVHTDSLLTTKEIPRSWIGSKLGDFVLEKKGHGLIIASGMYQISNKIADRGFHTKKGFTWKKLLRRMKNRASIELPETRVLSWIGALHQDRPDDINRFLKVHKKFSVNCDLKRCWNRPTNARKLLTELEHSQPSIVYS